MIVLLFVLINKWKTANQYKKNKKKFKAKSNINMINYESLKSESIPIYQNKNKGVPVHQNNKEDDLNVPIHLSKKEIERMETFKLKGLSIFKSNIRSSNLVSNWRLLEAEKWIINFYNFFHWLQKYMNILFKNWEYDIPVKDLFLIHKEIWKWDILLFRKILEQINLKNWFTQDSIDITDVLFRKILIETISDDNYKLFKDKDEEDYNKKFNLIQKVVDKASSTNDEIHLTANDKWILDEYEMEIEIWKEIMKITKKGLRKWFKFWLLKVDIERRELEIRIEAKDLFSREIQELVKYYSEENSLDSIIFYI